MLQLWRFVYVQRLILSYYAVLPGGGGALSVAPRPSVCPRDVHGLDSSMDWIGLDWIGLDWTGLDWVEFWRMLRGLDWIGSDDCYVHFFDFEP